jgi:fructose-1-phosphate kinase PfkB-like protein
VHNAVNRADDVRVDVAGKAANVTRVLTQLDVRAVHLSHAGGTNRELWLQMCAADDLAVVAPIAPGDVRTCVTIAEQETGKTTEYVEPSPEVDDATAAAVRTEFLRLIDGASALLVCGSMAPGFAVDTYDWMIGEAKQRGIRVGVDLHGQLLRTAIRLLPDLVKINVREYGQTFTPELRTEMERLESEDLSLEELPKAAARITAMVRLHAEKGITVVLSQGARPTLYLDASTGRLASVETIPLTPVNPIGSGDTMMAGVASRFFGGLPLAEAIEYGHTLAAINASLMKPGTVRA